MVEWEQGAGGGQLSEMWSMKTDTPPCSFKHSMNVPGHSLSVTATGVRSF